MIISDGQVRDFASVYLVSNTPAYLYRHLRALPAVQQLACENDLSDLVSGFADIAARADRSAEDAALAYACLVAMSCLDRAPATQALLSLDASALPWGGQVRDICVAKTPVFHASSVQGSTHPTAQLAFVHGTFGRSATVSPQRQHQE